MTDTIVILIASSHIGASPLEVETLELDIPGQESVAIATHGTEHVSVVPATANVSVSVDEGVIEDG